MNDEATRLLREILIWQKVQAMHTLKDTLPQLLDSALKKEVYEMTDGVNSTLAISKKTKVATGTISNWWNKWTSFGIVTKESGRYKKIISLKDVFTSGSVNDNGR